MADAILVSDRCVKLVVVAAGDLKISLDDPASLVGGGLAGLAVGLADKDPASAEDFHRRGELDNVVDLVLVQLGELLGDSLFPPGPVGGLARLAVRLGIGCDGKCDCEEASG